MENFYLFFLKHWVLSLTFCASAGTWLFLEGVAWVDVRKIKPEALVQRMNAHKVHVIDLRDAEAFTAGHILGALHVPLPTLPAFLKNFKKKAVKAIVLVDQEGHEARKNLTVFLKEGFQEAFYLEKGLQGWRSAGMPLERPVASFKK